ncbi:MAG: hypothetical protein ACKOZU_11020 [Planctomycetaceae bacterium]
MRDGRARTITGRAALAIAVAALGGWLVTEATGPARHARAAATGGRCILCNAFGASNLPRICNTCNNKH